MKDLFKKYFFPIATMAGSIIGVGFLSLPYIMTKVGFVPMLFYFIVLTALVAYVHVIFGRISLRTPDFKRWPGFVGYYFGAWSKRIILVLMTAGILGVMLVYLIVGSQFLSVALIPFLGGNSFEYVLLYFALGSLCIYFGVKAISRVDFVVLLLLVGILVLIVFRGFSKIHGYNLMLPVSHSTFSNAFLPYGALLFSLWGAGFIPEIEEMVRGNKKSLIKILIFATILPAVFYLAFTLLVVSITGKYTTESALLGLEHFLGQKVMFLALLMGVVATFIAFIAQGLLLKKIFMYDLGFKEFPSWILVCMTPLVLFLLGFNSFIPLISFIGGVLLSIDGALVLLMYRKIGGRKIIVYPLVIFFVLGIVYELLFFFV